MNSIWNTMKNYETYEETGKYCIINRKQLTKADLQMTQLFKFRDKDFKAIQDNMSGTRNFRRVREIDNQMQTVKLKNAVS